MFDLDLQPMTTRELRRLVVALGRLDPAGVGDAERVDRIRLLEQLKAAASAAQVRETVAFAASQTARHVKAGVTSSQVGAGIAGQVGLARRESPYRARRYLGWAKILTAELPGTLDALTHGRTTEWRAMLVARETAWLAPEHRAVIDAEVAPLLSQWGDGRVEAEVRTRAYRLDPHGYTARRRSAEADRRVTLRPAPDTMSRLTGLLPVAQGVAVHAALGRHADSLRAAGDARSRGQIMADTLVERVTGQAAAAAVPIQVNLVMTDTALLGDPDRPGTDEPALMQGAGPVPAPLARGLLRTALTSGRTGAWVRRLYAHPSTGQLVAMDSSARRFPDGLAAFLDLRDQTCRTPWCDAPIRHHDHARPAARGGPTSAANGQGLCEACSYAKEAPGWAARPSPAGAGHRVDTTTPTGHTYRSRPPDPPGSSPPAPATPLVPCQRRTAAEWAFTDVLVECA